ncbi:MAG TPA: GNAT family N-acetyltransferase [Bryobacteraceae bacterium]|nr:GNAT family N-acetyltransferase [Bryobacteraceae bacterium]
MEHDAAICGPICYEAFAAIDRQHNFPPDLPSPEVGTHLLSIMFSHPKMYCIVAEAEGRIVGSNCLDERSIIAGVGPVTVDPRIQNRRIGRALMEAVLDRARQRQFAGVRLVQAAFHNRSMSLYTKLGFVAREPLSIMQGPAIMETLEGTEVRPAQEADVEAASVLCERVHGHNRAELRDGIRAGSARAVIRTGALTGYASSLAFFGHAVGETNEDLQALIATAESFGGPGILVPTRNPQLLRWCLEKSLRIVYPMTLMTIGLYNEPTGAYMASVTF